MEEKEKIELCEKKHFRYTSGVSLKKIRIGMLIMAFVVMCLYVVAYCVPYVNTVTVDVKALDNNKAIAYIPYEYINEVKRSNDVSVEFLGYDPNDYGYKYGIVDEVIFSPITYKKHSCFVTILNLSSDGYSIVRNMEGEGELVLSRKSLLCEIFGKYMCK